MKLRTTFVSNSSSSSFLLQLPPKLTLQELIDLGIEIDTDADIAICNQSATTYTALKEGWKKLKRTRHLTQEDDSDVFEILLTTLEEVALTITITNIAEGYDEIRIQK
jgi:hypothetical protein